MNQTQTYSQQRIFSPSYPLLYPPPFEFSSDQESRSFHFSDLKQPVSSRSYQFYSPQKQHNMQYQYHSYYPNDRDNSRMTLQPLSAVQSQSQAFQQMFDLWRQSIEEQSQRKASQTQEHISQRSSMLEDQYLPDDDPVVDECKHEQQSFFIGQMKSIEDFYLQMNIQTDLDPSIEDLNLSNCFSGTMQNSNSKYHLDTQTTYPQHQVSFIHDDSTFGYSPEKQKKQTQQSEANTQTPKRNLQWKNQQEQQISFNGSYNQDKTQMSPEQHQQTLDSKWALRKDQEEFTKSQEKGSSSNEKQNNLLVDSPNELMFQTNTNSKRELPKTSKNQDQNSTKYQQVIRNSREYDEKPISSMGATKNFEELLEEKIKESEKEKESKSAFKNSQSEYKTHEKQENNLNSSAFKDVGADQRCLIEKLLQEIVINKEQILNKFIKEKHNDSSNKNEHNSECECLDQQSKQQLSDLIRRIQECWIEIVAFNATLSAQSALLQTQKTEIFSMKEKLEKQRKHIDRHNDQGNILNNSNSNNKQIKEQLLVVGNNTTGKEHFNSQQLNKRLREQINGLKEQLQKQAVDSQLKIKQLEKSLHSAQQQSGQLRKEVVLLQKSAQFNKLDEAAKIQKLAEKTSKQQKSLMSQSFQVATSDNIIPVKIIKKSKVQEQKQHKGQFYTERPIISKSKVNQSQIEKERNSGQHSVDLQPQGFQNQNKVETKVSTNCGKSTPLKDPQVSQKEQTQKEQQ